MIFVTLTFQCQCNSDPMINTIMKTILKSSNLVLRYLGKKGDEPCWEVVRGGAPSPHSNSPVRGREEHEALGQREFNAGGLPGKSVKILANSLNSLKSDQMPQK